MLVLASASSSWAQIKTIEPTQESGNPEQPTIYQMTVSAAAEPKPALKYHFLVPPVDQIHGNAATLYYKSLGFEGPDQINAVWKLMSDDETDHLLFEAPLDQFPKDKAAEVTAWLQDDQGYKSWLTKAAQCDYCDWEDQIREQGMYTLLPLAQKTRGLAEALALRARWLMAQNKPEEAIEMLRLNYALGEALGHGTTLIHSLIGIAIQGITNEQTSTLISLDHSPNLYWALTDLAVHPVNIRQAMSYESHFWPFTIHELADLDRRALTADEALTVATQLLETQRAWTIRKPKPMDPNVRQAELLGLAVALYPQARSYLLDHGYKAEQIEVMPVLQTVLLMWWKQFELVRDDTFKWLTLSDDEIRLNLARMEEGVRAAETRGEGGVFTEALPAIQATVGAHFRHQRKINLLRTVEALRMYAADHSRWPEKLDDVTQVPVPLDPWTQKPFDYSVKDGVAILEAPRKPKAPWPLETDERFELTLRSADAKPQPTHLQEK
jgi:hypothetical protein